MKTGTKIIVLVLVTLVAGIVIGRMTGGSGALNSEIGEVGASTWTCSMDPQVRQDGPGSCPICGMDLIPLIEETGVDDLRADAIKMSKRAMALANVQTTVVGGHSSHDATLSLNGRVVVDESRIYSQTSHFPGRVEQLYVTTEGEFVRTGQRIARLYSPELITAQEELFEAKRFAQDDLVESVRKKLSLWKLSESEIQAIEASGQVRNEIDIHADVSGIVTRKHINVGSHLKEGAVLYEVADLSSVWVVFDAYEKDLGSIKKGDQVSFEVPAYPGKQFQGRVSFIDPLIDPKTRTAAVRIEIANSGQLLKPDMLVRGTLKVTPGQLSHGLMVPATAVLWTGERSVVYVREGDTSMYAFVMKEVMLGDKMGDAYMIHSGIKAGDEIVTNGTFTVDAAAQLQGKKSMMNSTPVAKPAGQAHSH